MPEFLANLGCLLLRSVANISILRRRSPRPWAPGQKSEIGHPGDPEVPDPIGGPWRTRTSDPLIKSQLLYQLS